ncbi:DUF2306 domain-containing protein [Aquimarina sp. 2201CG5-10]|uniref:DUF2306 domain-containing protein n=1 Tax=Aquimarina callyspongiae TaxID=3098150 RepID=UPI002AB49772|nr:DUF2306 domain-containing protein [Aquimarina sp. 2201CG5-10]MDY8135567.1 DUF2306 domain-containing protein [Aquimarina sp. 2201CG5-10]
MKKSAWIIFGSLCIIFSFYPMKYLLADTPVALQLSKSVELLNSNVYNISFYAHIIFGGIALLVGWLQFSKKLRAKYINLHRTIGKIYVTSVLISGPFGFYIALFASGGLSPKLGFSIGALLWTILTFLGYSTIRKGRIEAHRKFMMYSYAGTFGAVTLRLWLPLLIVVTDSFVTAYGIVAWLSWIPNMMVVYLVIHKKPILISIYKKYRIKKIVITSVILVALMFPVSCLSLQTWFYKKPSIEGVVFEKIKSSDYSSFTPEKLNEIDTYLKEESETTSMLILENGKIVYEYGDVSEISYIASCRKSVLAILYGKYVTNGTIDLNQTIGAMGIDEDDTLLPIEKEATVDHIITSRSGVFHLPANGGYDKENIKERGSVKPGEYFVYNNWDFNVAGYILEKKSGNTVYEELEQQLAIPLGFQDWNIKNQKRTVNKDKSRYSAYHMHLSTRDMAKIGQLMLQKGKWNDKQIVSADWINKITTRVTHTDTVSARYRRDKSSPLQESYGYMWWLYERFYDNPDFEGGYTASGYGGQFITVIPKRNVVIAHKTTMDILTYAGLSERSKTPSWKYWWLLRNLMLNGKSISQLSTQKSTDEIIKFIRTEYQKDSEYAISERLINEYGLELTENNNCEDAIKFFELNLELYPKGYYTHRTFDYYGDCLLKLGRKEEAIRSFENSLEFNPENFETKEKLSKLKTNV